MVPHAFHVALGLDTFRTWSPSATHPAAGHVPHVVPAWLCWLDAFRTRSPAHLHLPAGIVPYDPWVVHACCYTSRLDTLRAWSPRFAFNSCSCTPLAGHVPPVVPGLCSTLLLVVMGHVRSWHAGRIPYAVPCLALTRHSNIATANSSPIQKDAVIQFSTLLSFKTFLCQILGLP